LRFDELRAEWELIMFQSAQFQVDSRHSRSRQLGNGFDAG
jgi:hypothetical protein